MYYLDSQRTTTRRDSSVILTKKYFKELDAVSTVRADSSTHLSESGASVTVKPRGPVRNEIVTLLFESMLHHIVQSWDVIVQQKPDDSVPNLDFGKIGSELNVGKTQKKKVGSSVQKTKRSRSKIEVDNSQVAAQSWWSSPDERAIIRFKNGNTYEGSISMKCMHGAGRFQWADGTIYMGEFKNNAITGRGIIQWKDDTWYEGEWLGNVRHGEGLFVDSRRQRAYAGAWNCGAKHDRGLIYYTDNFRNSYDGQWVQNVRDGFGTREYCPMSGYKGEWDKYVREGKGLMIWPNHDFYRGEWKNGEMSGQGIYIWDTRYNHSMSHPSLSAYRGQWKKGRRHGYGLLNLGFGLGSYYKGEFKNNKKHGAGKFVSNNGLIIQDKKLFIDDNLTSLSPECTESECKCPENVEPYRFDVCDSAVGLLNHIEHALKNIDKQQEIRKDIVNEYIINNKATEALILHAVGNASQESIDPYDFVEFEESSLKKALRCYETELKNIYYKYSTICNNKEINFTPVMIRLYLWQLYYDCGIHTKGLTLVEIDRIFYQNPEWLANTPHNPFEKIYFWQFLHSLISVASRLYCKKQLPSTKPDTILGSAFREFMNQDVLPGVGLCKGRLVNSFGELIPLQAVYKLYRSVGEPHSVRAFLCAARHSALRHDGAQPPMRDVTADLPRGANLYIYGDEMYFVTNGVAPTEKFNSETELKLFNFGNLSSRNIINIFANIFPQIIERHQIIDLNVDVTFFEFFEAFVTCAEESIRIQNEEIRWRERFSVNTTSVLPATSTTRVRKAK